MIDFIKKSVTLAFAVVTVIFTFVPESFFGDCDWISQDFLKQCKLFSDLDATDVNIVISRLVCFALVWIAVSAIYALFLKFRRWTTIHGENRFGSNMAISSKRGTVSG